MSAYPNFDLWYKPKQDDLKKNELAKYFLRLRNHLQKVGSVPIANSGSMIDGNVFSNTEFISIPEIKDIPSGNVIELPMHILLTCWWY